MTERSNLIHSPEGHCCENSSLFRSLDSSPHLSMLELTERIQKTLCKGQYICQICINRISRISTLWSCSSCYTVFHLMCMHQWIKKVSSAVSVTEQHTIENSTSDSTQSARRSVHQNQQPFRWNCPNCRAEYSQSYLPKDKCWCGQYNDPKPNPPGQLTHSCFGSCPRKLPYIPPSNNNEAVVKSCTHPCSLLCHPGPCPKCAVVIEDCRCKCGRSSRTLRCAESLEQWSCGAQCGKDLDCGNHKCKTICHSGRCLSCPITLEAPCLCGCETVSLPCGVIEIPRCKNRCNRVSASCRLHTCDLICHVQPKTHNEKKWSDDNTSACYLPCPREPSSVTHCPCGRNLLTPDQKEQRQSCSEPIPTCMNKCEKMLLNCHHYCQKLCHDGPCGPCDEPVSRTCRCGNKTNTFRCSEWSTLLDENNQYQCQYTCNMRKTCNRHRCLRRCCPSRLLGSNSDAHFCLEVCNKKLSCGKHNCDLFCHVGHCLPCRVFTRPPVVCACGLTVINEPLMCGTDPPECPAICGKIIAACQHTCSAKCHNGQCPPCLTLVDRLCAGGHTTFQNVRCWVNSSRIFCRSQCGKILQSCQHRCNRLCHSDDCGPCNQSCGRLRKYCSHPCTAPCHPKLLDCPDIPCDNEIGIACECGKRKEITTCGAYSGLTVKECSPLPCDIECSKEKRQRQLAEAFSDAIRPVEFEDVYDEELVDWAIPQNQLVKEIDILAEETLKSTSLGLRYTSTMKWDHLLWIDYYLQFYWRLKTEINKDSKDSRSHLAFYKDHMKSRIPNPKLSQLPQNIFELLHLPKPKNGFVNKNVIRFGFDSFSITCEDVPADRCTHDIVSRIVGLKPHLRLRWCPSVKRMTPRLPRKATNRGRSNVSEEFPQIRRLVPSSFGMFRPNLVIEALDETLGKKILEILIHSPLFFGRATSIAHPMIVSIPEATSSTISSKRNDNSDDEWTVVSTRKK